MAGDQLNLPSVACPFCQHPITRVTDVREDHYDPTILRRRRECRACRKRFTTIGPAVLSTQEKVLVAQENHNI